MTIEAAQTEVVEQPQSLRDVVEQAVNDAEEFQEAPEKPERARDETGKFAPTERADKAEKPAAKAAAETKRERPDTQPDKGAATAAPAAAPAYVAPAPPSSWKKELHGDWVKLPPAVHAEIARRENDYIKGVTTYKGEYDRVRPLWEALKPFEQMLQQAQVTPDAFVRALATTHQNFASGNKDVQLRELARFVQEYKIPIHEMLVQGEDGKIYFNQQYSQPAAREQQAQPGLTREEARAEAQQVWVAAEQQRQMSEFLAAKDGGGNPRYPHFEDLKATMDGLLRAGLARDLPSAYDAALRHPNHSALYDAQATQLRATQDAERVKVAAAAAEKAKASRISARPRTPTGAAASGAPKGLRETIEDSVEEHSRG